MLKDYLEAGKFVWGLAGALFVVLGVTYLDGPLAVEKLAGSIIAGFFVPLGVYSFNLVTDYKEDSINKKSSVVVSKRKTIAEVLGFSLFCKAAAIVSSFFAGWAAMMVVLAIVLTSFLYSFKFGFGRLKEVFLVKNIAISSAWSILPLVPILAAGFPLEPAFLIIVFFVFIHCFISSIIGDLKDVEGDIKSNVKTLPIEIGFENTLHILTLLNALSLLAIVFGVLFFQLKLYVLVLLPVTLERQYTFWIIGRGAPVNYVYTNIDNPTYAFIGLLGFVGKMFWLYL